jgi:uncharacterized protein with GYD domain
MAKFMVKGSYTAEGAKGFLKDGGTGRRAAVQKAVEGLGGSIESFYFSFGDADVYVVVDLPDSTSAAALSLAVNSQGRVELQTIPLLTPEEMDEATKKSVEYRAPGQ